ncbi:hypothetical protein LX15_003526 [Streptoalloteichus tenebrarius]|uniref:DinB-like domain-containing protein n=1 Tax=Streptoalloteichus tenebrarius (strain ATCC 17920 / DSM 40477 / JCM 4838 / CBS 697.72 / NBRC 16177 / NCIMB 11028 / NRRL B-12390 / A12253. 1 / ISP 5477) TaxID=1933 RepID=A0ABT1HWB5_STRSD|nr:hypothetical protein [Streptoalloteichus tenebrarius]MCP2259817.1 hypothetical protein [Streptoalloteichus tenebrarius]BFE99234.1 hypothetical protein GCM10020241_09100 [Streptoalloteichus tenebrarius]
MHTNALAHAYGDLLKAASALTSATPLDERERADTDWTLVHVALSDRLLATAARDVLAGTSPLVDNSPAMDPAALSSLITSTTHEGRVDLVRRNGAEFLGLVRRTPEEAAAVPVRLRVFGRDGRHVADGETTWGELVRLRAEEHLPGHAARLAGYVAAARNRSTRS